MKRFILIATVLCVLIPASAQETKENADFKLAVSLFNDKLYDLALEQFRQFVAAYPNTSQGIEARFYLGLTQRQMKKYEDARFTFQNFALAFPDHPKAAEAWWNVAEAYVALKNLQEAALAFERVKTFHPKSPLAPEALLKASTYFEASGDGENSKKTLRALTEEYGSSKVVLEARLRLAKIYFSEKQYELARIDAGKVADGTNDPVLAPAALQLSASALSRLGRPEEAKKALNVVVEKYRSNAAYFEALLALAELNAGSGSFDEARKIWKEIIDSKEKPPAPIRESAFLAQGDAELLQGRGNEALASFESAMALRSVRSGEAAFKAARSAERLGNARKAGEWYLRAVEDSGGTVDRRAILAGAVHGAKLVKDFNLMTRYAQRFRDQYPRDPSTPAILLGAAGVYLGELNDPRHAQDLFETIISDFPENELIDDALFGTARALRKSGQLAEALRVLESIPRRFPASDLLDEARALEFEIVTFDQKDKEGGVKNMALLTGDVIAGKPKGELALRLAEIYFNDLKDYASAADQYGNALQSPLSDELRATAWYHRAKSFEFQAWEGLREGKSAASAEKAIAAYDSLLRSNPEFPSREDALLARLDLKIRRARNIAELRKLSEETRKERWTGKGKETALLALGEAYQSMKSNKDAAQIFSEILRSNPSPSSEARALFLSARSRSEMGERDSATIFLNRYNQKYPGHEFSAEAALMGARYEAERGSTSAALLAYRTLAQQYFYTHAAADVDLLRGDAYYASGSIPDALKSYLQYSDRLRESLFPFRDQPTSLIAKLAECYRRTGNRAEAKQHYARLLAADTSSSSRSQIYYILASMAREENDLETAARYLDVSRAGATSPEQRQKTALEELELLLKGEDYKTALARIEELLPQVKSDSLKNYLQSRMIVSYFRMDNLAEADKRFTAFVRANPKALDEAAEFDYERGRYHLRKEETDLAIRRLENVRSRYPRSPIIPENVYWLARAFEMKGDLQRATKLYDSLLTRFSFHPIVPRVRLSLGNVYYNLEQWDAAARQYKTIVDSADNSPDLVRFAMSNLIMAYKEIGLFDAALQLNRQYLDRYPNDPDLITRRIDIGVIYQKLGYYDQSIVHLEHMLQDANPELEGELRYYIGEAYFYKGAYQQAILEFLKVPYLITRPTKIDWVSTSYYMAGQSYEKMSKFDEAITMYKQILARPGIDPTFKTAAQKEIDRVNVLVRGGK